MYFYCEPCDRYTSPCNKKEHLESERHKRCVELSSLSDESDFGEDEEPEEEEDDGNHLTMYDRTPFWTLAPTFKFEMAELLGKDPLKIEQWVDYKCNISKLKKKVDDDLIKYYMRTLQLYSEKKHGKGRGKFGPYDWDREYGGI